MVSLISSFNPEDKRNGEDLTFNKLVEGGGGTFSSPESYLAEAPGESFASNRKAVGHGAVPYDRHER